MTDTICNLSSGRVCKPCEGGVPAMSLQEEQTAIKRLPLWTLGESKISRRWVFANHYQAIAFVNAVAWVSHRENHHPLMEVGFKDVKIIYWTHAVNGLSENDFICADMLDRLAVP